MANMSPEEILAPSPTEMARQTTTRDSEIIGLLNDFVKQVRKDLGLKNDSLEENFFQYLLAGSFPGSLENQKINNPF